MEPSQGAVFPFIGQNKAFMKHILLLCFLFLHVSRIVSATHNLPGCRK